MRKVNGRSEIMTLREAARFIRVSEKTLGEMARKRSIPGQKAGREWRFLRSALEAWLSRAGQPEQPQRAEAASGQAGAVQGPVAQCQMPVAGFRDTAFTENRDRAMHRWVPWIAGFSASFVDSVLGRFAHGNERLTVLDPFAGVGTTLLEVLKHGHDALGFEINPYAALACRAKTNAAACDVRRLRERIEAFQERGTDRLADRSALPRSAPPQGFRSRVPFFSPEVERQVLFCLDFIAEQKTPWVRDLFRVALGSVMVSFSNYSYEPSLGTREAAGKPNVQSADVFAIVGRKLEEMAEDIVLFQSWMSDFDRPPRVGVVLGSYLDSSDKARPHSVDLLITSPPYLNNYHYIRNTRPQMYWLGMVRSPSDLIEMERKSFGQFWQTVRTGPVIELKPHLPELAELIRCLRKRNVERGAYGGHGWANYAASYFNDCQRFCSVTRDLLKPGATALVVIGNNILQGIEFPTDRLFAEIARREGFEIVEFHEVRSKRTGSSIVNSSVRSGSVKKMTRLYETAVEMRTPSATRLSP